MFLIPLSGLDSDSVLSPACDPDLYSDLVSNQVSDSLFFLSFRIQILFLYVVPNQDFDPDPKLVLELDLAVHPHLSRSIIDAARRPGGAASLFGLTRIDGHADSSVAGESLVTGTQVLVWTGVDAGRLDVTDALDTRVYS